jgi:hypothetical protein
MKASEERSIPCTVTKVLGKWTLVQYGNHTVEGVLWRKEGNSTTEANISTFTYQGERFGNTTTEADDEATFIRRARACYGRAEKGYGRTGYGRKIGR